MPPIPFVNAESIDALGAVRAQITRRIGQRQVVTTAMATRWLQRPRIQVREQRRLSGVLRTMRGQEVCGWSCTSPVRWPRPLRGEGHTLRLEPARASSETPRERALSPRASGAAYPTKLAHSQSFDKLPNAVSTGTLIHQPVYFLRCPFFYCSKNLSLCSGTLVNCYSAIPKQPYDPGKGNLHASV